MKTYPVNGFDRVQKKEEELELMRRRMESLVVQRKEGMWRKERMGESAWLVENRNEK